MDEYRKNRNFKGRKLDCLELKDEGRMRNKTVFRKKNTVRRKTTVRKSN